jgi:DNA-directed RNA polymerase specialized sigma24 family protein
MLAAIPNVRAFARSMCRNSDQADVLVQKALLCGWSSIDSLESGTNMTAWLITILRRFFYLSYPTERRSLQLSGSYVDGKETYEHPVVAPHVSHFMHVPFLTKVKLAHSLHISPS